MNLKSLEEIKFWMRVGIITMKILITCTFLWISLALVNIPFTPVVICGSILFVGVVIYWGRKLILTMKKGEVNEKI